MKRHFRVEQKSGDIKLYKNPKIRNGKFKIGECTYSVDPNTYRRRRTLSPNPFTGFHTDIQEAYYIEDDPNPLPFWSKDKTPDVSGKIIRDIIVEKTVDDFLGKSHNTFLMLLLLVGGIILGAIITYYAGR